MNVGTAWRDITPQPGIDLAGFAVRSQPSTEVLDPLAVRVLSLQSGTERFVWVHGDLLAFAQSAADRLRDWIADQARIDRARVLVSTTHTHSAPALIALTGCGRLDPAYVARVEIECQRAVAAALADAEPCRLVASEGRCELGVDRRQRASAHTDPRVGALGWRRGDGTFKAVFLDYSMHPVCLRDTLISADWPGAAARRLSEALPGNPLAFVCAGACANVNPPAVGVAPGQMQEWGQRVAETVLPAFASPAPQPEADGNAPLQVTAKTITLPGEEWGAADVQRYTQTCLADPAGQAEFGHLFGVAAETWQATLLERLRHSEPLSLQAELGAIRMGPFLLLTVNAEIFSRFTALAGADAPSPVYTISCANGMVGYVPPLEAYAEGAYEVAWAMFFYNQPRPRAGGLELLVREARSLIAQLGRTDSSAFK